jgi:SSS family solute:Na+ symporter/sodium/proline symporter
LSLTWKRLTRNGALAGIIAGASTVLLFIYAPLLPDGKTLSTVIYEIVPGFLACGIVAILVSLAGKAPDEAVVRTFEEAEAERRRLVRGSAAA